MLCHININISIHFLLYSHIHAINCYFFYPICSHLKFSKDNTLNCSSNLVGWVFSHMHLLALHRHCTRISE